MRYHAPSRRLFLCGAGATLTLPFLESLVPRAARAATEARKPVRYIQLVNAYGPTWSLFFGSRTTNTRVSPNVNVQKLTEVDGAISPMFGTEYNPFKSRMSLLGGLDTLARNSNHAFCFTTCASSYDAGLADEDHPPSSGQQSVDSLLAGSSKVYGTEIPQARRLISLNPDTTDAYVGTRSFTWQPASNGLQMVNPIKTTDAFFGVFESGFGQTARDPREDTLISTVYEDFRRVRDSTRISSSDRQRLDNYMGLVSDITLGASSCVAPERDEETTSDARLDNQFRLLAAAMACDLTRVANITLGMSASFSVRHPQHHKLLQDERYGNPESPSPLRLDMIAIGKRVARLLTILDSVTEDTGTLFDNSIVYYSMQYGMQQTSNQHNTRNMAVMVAGGGGGALDQGRYISYLREVGGDVTTSNRAGIPINNLLVTIMNAMGLSSSDYELSGHQGYGDYPEAELLSTTNRADIEFWGSTAGRRTALPVLYKGTQLG